jgi:hypothetical protein
MKKLGSFCFGVLGIIVMGQLMTTLASAEGRDREWHRKHWGEGHWVHDRHDGRLGWWWVVGESWHFFPHPVAQPNVVIVQQVPQQAPQPVIIQQAPPVATAPVAAAPASVTPTMYYCKATGNYYPETMTCPNGWTPISAGSPPSP